MSAESPQPSLFPELEPQQPEAVEVDTAAIAGAGERRNYDPNERQPSKAALEQGAEWRAGRINQHRQPIPAAPRRAPRPLELPGKNGRRNRQPLTKDEVQRNTTPESRASMLAGFAALKAAHPNLRKPD